MNCECGCGRLAPVAKQTDHRKGYVKGQRLRFVLGHNPGPPKRAPDYEERDCGFSSPCWIWLKSTSRGYGKAWDGQKKRRAHRLYWTQINGPIPKSYELDHLCRNRACVNPSHLEVVTHRENVRRRWEES